MKPDRVLDVDGVLVDVFDLPETGHEAGSLAMATHPKGVYLCVTKDKLAEINAKSKASAWNYISPDKARAFAYALVRHAAEVEGREAR